MNLSIDKEPQFWIIIWHFASNCCMPQPDQALEPKKHQMNITSQTLEFLTLELLNTTILSKILNPNKKISDK